jgi:PilZ domain
MRSFGKSSGGGRRKSARSQAPLLATLSTVSSDYRVGLVNVSSTGAQVSAPYLPELGEGVIFKADKVVSLGQVVWSEAGQCGVAFERPITGVDAERLRNEADVWRSVGWSSEDLPKQKNGSNIGKHSEAAATDRSGPELLAP